MVGSPFVFETESGKSVNAGYACCKSHTLSEIAERLGAEITVVAQGEFTVKTKVFGVVIECTVESIVTVAIVIV